MLKSTIRISARLMFGIGLMLSGYSCGPVPSSDVGAAMARKLSQGQLESLYVEMERLHGQLRPGEVVEWGTPQSPPLPVIFAQAGAKYGDVGHLNRLVFGGAMDDKAVLVFDGLDRKGARRIRLLPGERRSAEVLWQEVTPSADKQQSDTGA